MIFRVFHSLQKREIAKSASLKYSAFQPSTEKMSGKCFAVTFQKSEKQALLSTANFSRSNDQRNALLWQIF
jgi:hypothetical protein